VSFRFLSEITADRPLDLIDILGPATDDWVKLGTWMAVTLTVSGRGVITSRITGSGAEPREIGWGTASASHAATTSVLNNEVDLDLSSTTGTRTTGTGSRVTSSTTNDTYRVTGTRQASGSSQVREAGLFDSNTIGAGNLFVAADFGAINLSSGDSIAFTFDTRFS
jgi:hypothetical protein